VQHRDRQVVARDVVSLSVHGERGVLDLHVPSGASSVDVATEYSRQAALPAVPELHTSLGARLSPEETLAEAGVVSGTVLIALPAGARPGATASRGRPEVLLPRRRLVPGPLSLLWSCVAVGAAALAGWFASTLAHDSHLRTATLVLLGAAAVAGVLPGGPLARHRVLAAPAFAAAAAYAIAWNPEPQRLPTILGVAALTAAVTAAVARSLGEEAEEGLRVWMAVGVVVFLASTLGALVGVDPHVVWAVLLVVALLASRLVPLLAVDVPDQYLLDLEKLAVTAWSARDRPAGRRGRIIVPRRAVAAVAESGRHLVTAACAAVLVVAVPAAYLLLRDARYDLDQIGARVLVGLTGVSFLLVARSYRHLGARGLLRATGVLCLAVLALRVLPHLGSQLIVLLAVLAVVVAALLVVVGVALGRGWRSAWWSRQAEVAEALAGSGALASLVVAVGIFRFLWELTG
jgi:hypothetical protein